MPLQPMLVPQRAYLEKADPTRGTWIDIRRRTYADDMARGELLKLRTLVDMPDGGFAQKVEVNIPRVRAWELFTTYGGCKIEIPGKDEEGKDVLLEPFTDKEQMGFRKFVEELGNLDPDVIAEWIKMHLIVNPEWSTFF